MDRAAPSEGDSESDSELVFEDAQETFPPRQEEHSECDIPQIKSLSLQENAQPELCSDTSVQGVRRHSRSLDHLEDNAGKSDSAEATETVKQSIEVSAESSEKDESVREQSSNEESSGEEFTEEMIEDMLRGEEVEQNRDGLCKEDVAKEVGENEDEVDKEDVEDDDEESVIDEDALTTRDAGLTDEEKEDFRNQAQQWKADGNSSFKEGDYTGALDLYTKALQTCPISCVKLRSIMYSNRAAAKLHLEKHAAAITDCTKAVTLNPNYLKPLLRRAELYEKTDKLDDALVDYQKVLEMDPSEHCAREACRRLPEQIKERNEKLKDEMLGKLKDLGNMVLKPFGLSTDNFKMQQDPNTGGYSVNFQPSPKQ